LGTDRMKIPFSCCFGSKIVYENGDVRR